MRLRLIIIVLISFTFSVAYAEMQDAKPTPFIFRITASACQEGNSTSTRSQTSFYVVQKDGLVTALHGVVGCADIRAITYPDGKVLKNLKIAQVDIQHDVALLQSKEISELLNSSEGVVIAKAGETQYEELYVIGHQRGVPAPLRVDLSNIREPAIRPLDELIPDAFYRRLDERGSPALRIQVLNLQGVLEPGHSGAPVFDKLNQVVGVVNGGLAEGSGTVVWAIPWYEIDWQDASQFTETLEGLGKKDPWLVFSQDAATPKSATPTLSPTPSLTPTWTPTAQCWEEEPNDSDSDATGPLRSGVDCYGFPDQWDLFSFDIETTGLISINLENHYGEDVELALYYKSTSNLVVKDTTEPFNITRRRDEVGRYYISIFTKSDNQSPVPYRLQVTYPVAMPTATPTSTSTPTTMPTDTPTATPTATETETLTVAPADTPTPTAEPTATRVVTPTATETSTHTVTPTDTPTLMPTPTYTSSPTATPTATNTDAPAPTATVTHTPKPPATPTVPPTETSTPTPIIPTATSTFTPSVTFTVTPSATNTPIFITPPTEPPTATSTPSLSVTVESVNQAIVQANLLNLRSGPGTSYYVLNALKRDTVLIVEGQSPDGKWLYVRLENDTMGWVARSYTNFISVAPTVPVNKIPPTSTPPPTNVATPTPSQTGSANTPTVTLAPTPTAILTDTPTPVNTEKPTSPPPKEPTSPPPKEPTSPPPSEPTSPPP